MEEAVLQDVQSSPSSVALDIDRVGVKHVQLPLVVKDRDKGHQHTVASVDMGVDLPAAFKGTHMSRFVEALENWREASGEELDYGSMKRLLSDVLERLQAHRAYARFSFPYFRIRKAPVTGHEAPVRYLCRLTGELEAGQERPSFLLELDVPVTTVCPCSKAISRAGAHGQRASVRIALRMSRFEWLEGFIDIAEESGSCPIYALLKRPDEKFVTEKAYDNALFVEDVVRNVAARLESHPHVTWFSVEVESEESIHGHNAFASIERDLTKIR
ncbi:MAG: GTP cyclohydrolase I FolE2, partial [Mailhella sp.]|nr:GTP cyclohydrolase I FolE2 [Mailhella sp.]